MKTDTLVKIVKLIRLNEQKQSDAVLMQEVDNVLKEIKKEIKQEIKQEIGR